MMTSHLSLQGQQTRHDVEKIAPPASQMGCRALSNKEDEMTSNRKLIGIGATALSLALAVATPAFAAGLRGGGAIHVGSGGFSGDQAIVSPVVSRADASYCAQRWAYYDPASGKYMGDDGQWHPCPG
jgi:hypothetical protein